MNYRDFLQRVIYVIINPIIQAMVKVGITPNMVTTIGFVGNLAATSLFVVAALMVRSGDMAQAMEMVGWGGATILFAGLFDMMDGRLARVSGKSSVFGALWDSTLDRYSEMVSLFGVSVVFLYCDWFWMGIATYAAILGSVMVSYVSPSRRIGHRVQGRTPPASRARGHHRPGGYRERSDRQSVVAGWRYAGHRRPCQSYCLLAHSPLP